MAGSKAGWARYLVWRVENAGKKHKYRIFEDGDGYWMLGSPEELLFSSADFGDVVKKAGQFAAFDREREELVGGAA